MKNITIKYIQNPQLWIAVGVLFSTLIFISPPNLFWLDLLQSFAFQALGLYGFAALLLLFLRKWVAGSAFAGAAILVGVYLQAHVYMQPAINTNARVADLKVAHFNVFVANRHYQKTLKKALDTDADLLSFQEVHRQWAVFLEEHLAAQYPYYHIVPGEGTGEGIAVFSRYPLSNLETIYWEDRPNIAGDIEVADSSIHFLASHTISPVSLERFHQRKRHLQQITEYLEQEDNHHTGHWRL